MTSLADPPQFAGLDAARAALLVRLRAAIAPILANNLLPHFTDHSVEHSDNVIRLVGELAALSRDTPLAPTPDELTIVYSACYLHDVGMHYERIFELGVVPESERRVPWQELAEATRRDLLRRYHHVVAANLVQISATMAPLGFVLDAGYHPARVAALCEAHCLDSESDRYRELTADGPNLRMGLLSGLLRMADVLDESRRRATRGKARTLDLELVSQAHWWRHYYTESITLDPREKIICLHFDFPPGRVDEYARIVPELQLPWVTEELERHRAVFSKNGLAWNVTHRIGSLPYSTTEIMPETVLTEMAKDLQQRRMREAEAQRAADLRAFDEARPLLRRQEDELEGQRQKLSPGEYLRRLHAHARDRWALGGRRAACMMLRFPFERDCGHLPERERVLIAIELAGWLRSDRQVDAARHILELVQSAADGLAPDGKLMFGYWCLLARCASESAAHPLADAAAERARSLARGTREQAALAAEHLERQYLRGDFPEIPADSDTAVLVDEGSAADDIATPADLTEGLLGRVYPQNRFKIARCRVAAHIASPEEALARIGIGHDTTRQQLDRIAVDFCRAEILFLDGCADQALQILDELATSAHSLPVELELTILDNRTLVRFAELQVDSDFYERHDRRRLHGVTFWDESAVLDGMIDADEGRHYDAVPAFWTQVWDAHLRMSWQGQRWAHLRLAREFVAIGLLADATWHAMLALDAKAAKQIGAALRAHGDPNMVRVIVDRLLRTARLHRHAQIACVVLGEVMDLIPEDQVVLASDFIGRLAAQHSGDGGLSARLEAAWAALIALIPRVDDQTRGCFTRIAIEHPAWRTPDPHRGHLIRIAHRAVAAGVPDAVRNDVVEAALALATQTKSDFDYADALNLLCQLAQHEPSKERIGAVLFPANGARGNVLLGQIAPLFGKHVSDVDAVAREARRQIQMQVQRSPVDQEPERLGYFTAECTRNNGRIAVCVGAGDHHLAVVRRNKDKVSALVCAELVDAMLAKISDSDNDLSNRAGLVEAIRDLADRLDTSTAHRAAATIRPLAEGRIVESTILMTSDEARHPLSRVSVKGNTPAQLRGFGILALAEIAKHHAPTRDVSLESLITAALTDVDREVRTFAYAAARKSASLSIGTLSAVLVGTQDSDSTVARVAWIVLAECKALRVPSELWDTVVLTLRKASRHHDATVRQAAAAAAVNLAAAAENMRDVAGKINDVLAGFGRDSCHSVRRQAMGRPIALDQGLSGSSADPSEGSRTAQDAREA